MKIHYKILIILLLAQIRCYSNDTLFVYSNHIEYNNEIYNLSNDGCKIGKWLEYENKNTLVIYYPCTDETRYPSPTSMNINGEEVLLITDDYLIYSLGEYDSCNKKIGLWKLFYSSGKLKNKIYYDDCSNIKYVQSFYENGNLMLLAVPVRKNKFRLKKFSNRNKIISEQVLSLKKMKKIFSL